MDLSSIISVIFFLALLTGFSIIGITASIFMFPKLLDKGIAFSSLIGILLSSYITWLIVSLKILEYSQAASISIFFSLLLLSVFILWMKRKTISLTGISSKIILVESLVFLGTFLFFLFVRIGNPDLWHPVMGGEKPMDLAFINALTRAKTLPPYDPWLSGEIINYYYFGQFMVSYVSKITSISTSIMYNIFISYLFAQSAVGAFSLGLNFSKSKLGGFMATAFLLFIGNFNQIFLIAESFTKPLPINAWYWTSTRIMPNYEINEFPYFTFLYADLHSHLISLPIILLLVGLLFSFYKTGIDTKRTLLLIFSMSLFLGIIRITNIWDYPSMLFLSGLTSIAVFLLQKGLSFYKKILGIFFTLSALTLLSNVFVLPFLFHYKTGSLGVGLYEGPFTDINNFLIINGFFIFLILSFFIFNISNITSRKIKLTVKLFLLLSFLPVLLLLGTKFYFLAFLAAVIFILNLLTILKNKEISFPLILSFTAIFLTMIPDLVDFKLGLGRMNTVFKFYFQSWILLAVACSFYATTILKSKKSLAKYGWVGLFIVLILACFSYIPTSTHAKIKDRYAYTPVSLDGSKYMINAIYNDQGHSIPLVYDYEAIKWINKNIPENPIILEASIPIYRWGSRISVYTGLPTVLGWDWHEIAHRQHTDPFKIQSRTGDISIMYTNSELDILIDLLKKYNVSFIYIGGLERAYYDTSGINSLISDNPNLFEQVYKNSEVRIYKVKLNGKHN